ncbi:hypothetical protein, partial [Streptomyces pratensis]|uniref:hypothetical protein n=1 Tax=Streptomyces pratensis TaxID=1169025 RepID=UPI0030196B3B
PLVAPGGRLPPDCFASGLLRPRAVGCHREGARGPGAGERLLDGIEALSRSTAGVCAAPERGADGRSRA